MKRSHSAIVVLMVMILIWWPGLQSVAAAKDNGDRPIRLSTTARFSPIGTMAGRAVVDGRAFAGSAPIWGGEVLQALTGDSLLVSLDGVGQVTLAANAVARLSTVVSNSETAGRNVLVVSLLSGSMNARLTADAGAYVEAAGSTLAAAPGAQFRVQVAEGHAALNTIVGNVTIEQQPVPGQRYILRPPAGQGSSLSVSARSTRQLQIQVTDENDHPVPDLPILFSLGNPCLGTLGLGLGAGTVFKGKTDKKGIASVPWVTGAAKCADTILVRVEGTDNTYTYRAQVSGGGSSFWTARNTAIVAGIAAGAGIGIGLAVANSGDNAPITPVPPPQVRP